jgi:ABC-type ATPase with predicted acetyltransferase domain
MAKHYIMDQTGHTTVEFDKTNTVDVEAAMARFDELTKKGFRYAPKNAEGQPVVSHTFDPTAEEAIFIPQLQGG